MGTNSKSSKRNRLSSALVAALMSGVGAAPALATGLSYSGRLTDLHGKPFDGPVDINVKFWTASSGGSQLGPTLDYQQTPLAQGVFQLSIVLKAPQLAQIFSDGSTPVYVEITALGKAYPRQQFMATPFALRIPNDPKTLTYDSNGNLTLAATSQPQDGQFLTKDGAGNLAWGTPSTSATQINNKSISTQVPLVGQSLVFDGSSWVPQNVAVGGGGGSGSVTTVSGSAPIFVASPTTTPVIAMTPASSVSSGYISASDYLSFSSMLSKNGGTMTGVLNMGANTLTNLATPSSANDAATKTYVDSNANFLRKDGTVALTGPWNVGSQDLSGVGNMALAASKTLGLGVYATDPSGLTPADKGKIWFNSSAAAIKYFDGSSIQALGAAGSGITSLNSNTASAQTINTGSSGTAPAVTDSGSAHTINIPLASASSVTAGLISNSDYTAFSSKQGAGNYLTALSGDISGAGPGVAVTMLSATGVAAGVYVKVTVDTKGRVTAGTSLLIGDIPSLPASIIGSGFVPVANGGTGLMAVPSADQILMGNGSGYSLTSLASGTGVSITNASGTLTINSSFDTSALVRKDGTTQLTGPWNVGSQALSNVGDMALAAARTLNLGTYAVDPTGLVAADKGKIWFNTASNQLKYWDGTAAQALGVSGAGLTNLNGLTASSQTFTVTATGTAPAINSLTSVHTFSIPLASAVGVTAGLLANSDYTAFNAKQIAGNYITALTGDLTAAGPGSAAATLAATGVTAATYAKVTVDSKGRVTAGASLTGADIPTLSAALITSGTLAAANGGTGVSSSAIFPLSGTIVTETATETLTNKTLTGAVISSISNTGTLTLPTTTDVLVGRATADTLTNKTLTAAAINGASSISGSTTIATTGTVSSGADTVAGNLTIQGVAGNSSKLVFNDKGSTNALFLRAPDTLSASTGWILPPIDGSSGQTLATNGAGSLSWAAVPTASGSAGGDLAGTYPNPTLAAAGTAGTYQKVSTDSKGRVTSGTSLVPADIPALPASIIASGILPVGNGGTGVSTITNNSVVVGGSSLSGVTGTNGQILTVNASSQPIFGTANLSSTAAVSGTLPVANGGTGLGVGTSGGIPYYSSSTAMTSSAALTSNGVVLGGGAGAAPLTTAAGSAYQVLRLGSGGGAPVFGALDLTQAAAVTGALGYANGGTGTTAAPTAGQIPIGNGSGFILAGLTGGTGISIVSGSGAITINATADASTKVSKAGDTMTGSLNLGANSIFAATQVAGSGDASALPADGTVRSANGVGSNITGGNLFLSAGNGTGTGGSGAINFQISSPGTTGATVDTLNTAVVIANNGNVGIGTSSPLHTLDVQSANTNSTEVTLTNTTAGGHIYNISSTGSASGYGPGNFAIYDNTVYANRLLINSTGNVGIGTTSPQGTLQVSGALLANTVQAQGSAAVTPAGQGSYMMWNLANAGFNGETDFVNNQGLGTGGFAFYSTNSGGTIGSPVMAIRANGNVGIGTASPGSSLDVAAVTNQTAFRSNTLTLQNYATGNSGITDNLYYGAGGWAYLGNGYGGAIQMSGSINFYTVPSNSSGANALVTPTNRMMISTAGNVGIGTTNPQAGLDVQTSPNFTASNYEYYNSSTAGNYPGSFTYPTSIRAAGRIVASEFDAVSDRREKENIVTISNDQAMAFIQRMDPVYFNWKHSLQHKNYGFIAQDLLKNGYGELVSITPKDSMVEVVDEDGFTSPAGKQFNVNYNEVGPLLTKVAQIHDQELEELKLRQAKLIGENAKLKHENDEIKSFICTQWPSAPWCHK